MNFQHIQYIFAIESSGSISKAAQKLFISQPYLSKVLHELELELGVTLFQRSVDGVRLTQEGHDFLRHAKPLLREMEHLQNHYNPKVQDALRLNLAVPTCSHGVDTFIRLLNELDTTEEFQFNLRETTSSEAINYVYTRVSDLAMIGIGEQQFPTFKRLLRTRNLEFRRVCSLEPQVVVRSGHPLLQKKGPIYLDDLYQYSLVLYDTAGAGYGLNMLAMYNLIDLDVIPRKILTNSRATLHNLLTRTDCVGLGIKSAMEQDTNFGILSVPIEGMKVQPDLMSSFYLIWRKDESLSQVAQMYIDKVIEYYGDESPLCT